MSKFYRFIPMFAAVMAMSACQEYDLGLTVEDIMYKKSFVETFGKIDPNQDFNMASQYAALCKSRSNKATRSTRAVPTGWSVTRGDLQLISASEVNEAKSFFPEGTFSPSTFAAADAYYISDGEPLYLRPIYSQTNSSNTIGVYDVENPENKLPIVTPAAYWTNDQLIHGRNFGYVYKVNIPAGVKYGFYLEREGGHTHYSEASLNKANTDYECQDCNITLAKSGEYIGFEDWGHNGGDDYDCNDMIFHVSPSLVDKVVKLDSWIVAFEDLGSFLDIDFNDVVLDVSLSGTTLTITPLAAGGTIPSVVHFKEGAGTDHPFDEIHRMLTGTDDYTQPLNANGVNPTPGTPVQVTVSEGYKLYEGLARGDIYIVTNQTSYNLANSANSNVITTCTIAGDAPKAIVVPSSWEWPIETCPITTAYPSFKDWVADATYDVWITNKKKDTFVKRISAAIKDTPETPSEMPGYVEGKGLLVELTKDGIHANDNFQYILPSYFSSAQTSATITIEGTTEQIAIYTGKDDEQLEFTYSYKLTGSILEDAKTYGIVLKNWTQKTTFDWSGVTVYVMIDGAVDGGGNQDDDSDDNQDDNGSEPTSLWSDGTFTQTFEIPDEGISLSGNWGDEHSFSYNDDFKSIRSEASSCMLYVTTDGNGIYDASSSFKEAASGSNGSYSVELKIDSYSNSFKIGVTNGGKIMSAEIVLTKAE